MDSKNDEIVHTAPQLSTKKYVTFSPRNHSTAILPKKLWPNVHKIPKTNSENSEIVLTTLPTSYEGICNGFTKKSSESHVTKIVMANKHEKLRKWPNSCKLILIHLTPCKGSIKVLQKKPSESHITNIFIG